LSYLSRILNKNRAHIVSLYLFIHSFIDLDLLEKKKKKKKNVIHTIYSSNVN